MFENFPFPDCPSLASTITNSNSIDWSLIETIDPISLQSEKGVQIMKKIVQQFLNATQVPIEKPALILKLLQVLQVIISYLITCQDKFSVDNRKKEIENQRLKEMVKNGNSKMVIGVQCPICTKLFQSIYFVDKHIIKCHSDIAQLWQNIRMPRPATNMAPVYVPEFFPQPNAQLGSTTSTNSDDLQKALKKIQKELKHKHHYDEMQMQHWIENRISTVENKIDQLKSTFSEPLIRQTLKSSQIPLPETKKPHTHRKHKLSPRTISQSQKQQKPQQLMTEKATSPVPLRKTTDNFIISDDSYNSESGSDNVEIFPEAEAYNKLHQLKKASSNPVVQVSTLVPQNFTTEEQKSKKKRKKKKIIGNGLPPVINNKTTQKDFNSSPINENLNKNRIDDKNKNIIQNKNSIKKSKKDKVKLKDACNNGNAINQIKENGAKFRSEENPVQQKVEQNEPRIIRITPAPLKVSSNPPIQPIHEPNPASGRKEDFTIGIVNRNDFPTTTNNNNNNLNKNNNNNNIKPRLKNTPLMFIDSETDASTCAPRSPQAPPVKSSVLISPPKTFNNRTGALNEISTITEESSDIVEIKHVQPAACHIKKYPLNYSGSANLMSITSVTSMSSDIGSPLKEVNFNPRKR